jgi:hypothetical protein
MTQDLNEQFINPELQDNQESIMGPAESSLFELDVLNKADKTKFEEELSMTDDKQIKDLYNTLGPIAKEEKISAFIDDKGNLYEEDSPAVKETALQEKFPDPPTEEAKARKKDELKLKMDEEVANLDATLDEMIQSGEQKPLNEKRRQKWKENKKKDIEFRYEKEFSDFVKGTVKDYTKKNKTEKEALAVLNNISSSVQTKIQDADNAIRGLDLSKVSMYSKDNINPEMEKSFQETLGKGISTYEQFSDAFEKGKIGNGSVIRIYDAWGYKSNVMASNATPVYYQAIVGPNGEKSIEKVGEGVVDPITGSVLGAIKPISNMSAIDIDPELSSIAKYESLKNDISLRTDITPEEKAIKIKNLDERNSSGLKKLNAAYDSLMSPYSGLSKEVKLAILASTYPNEFKEKYAELSAESKSAEETSERILKAFGGILVSPVTAVTMVAGAGEAAAKELSRIAQGKPEGVLPTGTLALEIQKNPEMAKYIDEAIKEAGPLSNQYLNSVEGLANLVSSAKAKMNNKDINSIIDQARNVYPKIQEALQSFSNTSNIVKVNISAYEAGALRILKQSGYNSALNDYKNAINALSNSDNKDIRDAYKFITLQSNLLNTELDTTLTERYATLSEEDRNFINTIGKELRFNKSEILGMTYDEAEKIYQLGKRAQSLFPSAELEDYKVKNEQGVLDSIAEYKQQFDMLKGSDIFSEKGKFILSRLNELDDEYNSAFSNTSMYSFPALTQDAATMKNALAYTNPAYGLGIGILNGIGDILGGLRETGQKLTGFSWDNFDANSRNISYSLGEFKKYLETVGETGNYAFDISKSIGEAFPQMVGFAGSFIVGGPIGGASYLAATMTGPKMREAAAAGLGDMGQATYAILSMGIEFGSEAITSETALFRAGKGKSVLTKELVEKIMAPKTRKEAFKEYANILWKKGAKTTWSGTLEAFEEEVANKGNYLLQSFYNGMMNTSFKPTVFTAQESLDTLITMIGTSALFKGVSKLKQMTAERAPIEEAKKGFVAEGMDKTSASIMAALTTKEGVARTLDIVKRVESGQIKESELNMPMYEKVRDVLLPAAMSANFSPNLSIEQRTVSLDNLVKASEVAQMLERGEISEADAVNPIQTYNQNAQTALRDVEYAKKQFGIDGTAMREMAYQFFGLADMATNKSGALDARTPEQMAAAEMDMTPLNREGFIGRLNEIYVENEDNAAVRRAAQNAIAKNPEGFVASEIQSTKNLIEKAKADYELASKQGPAPVQLARIDDLTDRLNILENAKSRYLNSQQYATEISTRPKQEGGQPSNLIQPTGVEQGQQEIRQGEGGVGQTTQQAADARNRNFGSQAKQAFGQVRQMMQDAGVSSMYMQPIVEGQELNYMDELASQVMENQPAVERQFGQAVVDRVNKYIADTGLDADMFAVRTAQQRVAGNRVVDARNALIDAINQSNGPANTANKKAVKTLVERLKKAFPNVKVIMDKKGFQAAVKDEAARDLMTKGGVVYGRILNGDVYLNPDYANYNTPIHEFGHLWLNAAKEIAPAVYNRGRQLIRDSEYMAKVQADPLYEGLSAEEMENEALATAIGDRGEQFVNDVQKQGFRNWVRRLIGKLSQYVGIFNLSKVELDLLTLDEFLNRANASLLAGEAVTFNNLQSVRDISIEDTFMAKQQSFKSQMIDLASTVMQRELSKGRTLEEARTIATSEVSAAVISNATGKLDNNAVQRQIERVIEEAYNERKIAEQAAARQRKISQAYTTPETQKILADANKSAQDIADSNKGKKEKTTAKQAYDTVLGQVKAGIDIMYANGTIPAGISWIDMMSLAPAIASDAVRASFPAANRQRFEGEDMVMMTTSQLIRESIKAQARTAREIANTGKEVNAIFKALLSQMANQFGGGLKLSTSEIKAITKSIQDNIFSNASIINVSENAAEEISKILEKAYRGKLAEETKKLFDKISSEAFKAQFIQFYAQQLKDLTGENIESTVYGIINSDATLEDIARLNTMMKGITSTKEGQRERRIDYIAPALNALASINPTVQQQIENKYESLLTKIKGLIGKATGPNAQDISSLDYEKMLGLMHDMEDVENRRQNIGEFTPEEQAEILKQYGILKLSPLGDIQQYVQARESEIKRDTALLVDSINEQKRTEASNIRTKIPNQLLYNQFLNMMANLDDRYLSSLSPKELLELKSALTDIVNNGNYNNFAYNQYIKSWQYKIRNEFRDWATSIAANRNKITQDGFTNMFKSKFKDFARVFGGAEGATPSADLIEKAFDLLFFHQMDVEFNTGFDEVGMGFLERELFGQLAIATDQALNQSQSNLAPLQEAMIALSDKSNRAVIKKAVGDLWKTYGVKDSLLFKRLMAKMRRNTAEGLYEEISVRMASIVANQIDHISNLRPKDERIDMILQRNILQTKEVGRTFKDFFGTTSLSSKFKDFDTMVDHIAYAALTENGTKTLKDLSEIELLELLTPMQTQAILRWREYIESNRELFEATQIITGKMNPALKNYIPRNVLGTGDITQIDDVEVYINGQVQTGISQQQLESRVSNTGKLNLNLNKVLLNNSKTLNTLYYAKPFLDAVKGMTDAIEDIKKPVKEGEEAPNQFSLAYAEGIKGALSNRVKDALLSNEKSVNDRFGVMYRSAAKAQAFAAKMWLLSPLRQLNDFLNNFVKTASVLAFETKKAKSLKGVLRAFSPRKAYYESDKGVFKWEDYVNIADYTGSPVYKMMSLYADNFIYEFRKTPEQLQRQQRAASWQDMAYKKIAWMEKFEDSFRRLEGESFDHEAFKDERGAYRALYATSVQKASMAADSMVDKQYGLASVARQPLRLQALVLPIIGSRSIRNTFGKNFMTAKRGSTAAMLTGFMQGYATRQYALVQSYVKQAFDTTTKDSAGKRLEYLTRALTEAVIPVYGYSMIRTVMSNLFTSVSAAISDAFDDEDEKKKIYSELETKSGWEKYKKKTELAFYDAEEDAIDNLVNTAYTLSINPQSQFLLRNAIGLGMFYFFKKRAVEGMMNLDREGVKQKKKDIKKMEQKMFGYFNAKMLNIYGGDEYNESVKTFYNADEAVAGWEAGMETLFGFSALSQVAGQVADISRLVNAAEGANVNKTDVAIASGLQLYGLIFANMYAPGGAGTFLSMLSGDATKAGRYMIGEQMRTLREYNWDHRKEKPRQMLIFPGERKGKMPGGGSPYGGGGPYGGKGAYGGGGAY